LEKEVKLEKENAFLKEYLAKYENSKNSGNSSIPPSKDENRPKKNQSFFAQPQTKRLEAKIIRCA